MDIQRKIDHSLYGDNDLPEYPARKLIIHVAIKGLQLGSVLGVFALTPAVALYYRKRLSIRDAFRYTVPASTILGGVFSLGLLYGKYYQGDLSSNDGVDDRAYRLHKNSGQQQVDRYSFIGFMTGLGMGSLFSLSIPAFSCAGIAAGVVVFGVQKATQKYSPIN